MSQVIILDNKSKFDLLEFEKSIRLSEPVIWLGNFDAEAYELNILNHDFENKFKKVIGLYKEAKLIGRCDLIVQTSYQDFSRRGYIDWIYVDKNHRKNGYGQLLLKKAMEYIEGVGCEEVYLFTAKNEEAQSFYKSFEALTLSQRQVAVKTF